MLTRIDDLISYTDDALIQVSERVRRTPNDRTSIGDTNLLSATSPRSGQDARFVLTGWTDERDGRLNRENHCEKYEDLSWPTWCSMGVSIADALRHKQ